MAIITDLTTSPDFENATADMENAHHTGKK